MEAYSVDKQVYKAQFGKHGDESLKGMLIDAGYEETWMLRTTNIKFSNINVDKQGNISATVSIDDTLDLRPNPKRSTAYNIATAILGFGWHDVLGASDEMKVKATWEVVLPAQ